MKIDKATLSHKVRHNLYRLKDTVKWIILAILIGIILGAVGALFNKSIGFVTQARMAHPQFLYLLPFGAMVIIAAYKYIGRSAAGGTNLVLLAIQKDEDIPLRMAPLIFIATTISHLAGASVGREGAALQLGGSIGGYISKGLKLNDTDKKTLIMTGMSSAFSALLGTPIAASIFSIEVVSVGIMHYSALLPCVIASFCAKFVAAALGAKALKYDIGLIPAFDPAGMVRVFGLAILCGIISILFCALLHNGEEDFKNLISHILIMLSLREMIISICVPL